MLTLILWLAACGDEKAPPLDSGAAVTDSDGDGYADDVDCDPDDAEVYPGARDMPYDGVDADCEGDDDYDYDGDGYAGEGGGGDDCDDGNPETHPGAIERCYNAFDEDCDGVWTESADCDGDGYDMSHDCWDEEASPPEGAAEAGFTAADIHPGAEDAWYDGVDADCETNDDFDQDDDGESSAAELEGGVDCDDLDAAVNTEADEAWNRIDDDCEGTVDVLSSRDETGSWYGDNSLEESYFGYAFDSLDDLDGDGVRDVVVGVPGTTKFSGRAYVLAHGEGIQVPDSDALATIEGSGEYLGWTVAAVSDGQGGQLAAVGAPAGSAVYLFDEDGLVGGDGMSGADALATISAEYTGWVMSEWTDGDGVEHIVTGSYADLKTVTEASIGVYGAPALAGGGTFTSDSAVWTWSNTCILLDVASAGDLDGDGVDELAFGFQNSFGGYRSRVASGADVATGGSGAEDGLEGFASSIQYGGAFDADGDGTDDLVVSDPGAGEDGYGMVWLVLAADALAGGNVSDLAFASYAGEEEGAAPAGGRQHGDFDGDGAMELVLVVPGDGTNNASGKVRALSGATVAAGGALSLSDESPSFSGVSANDQFGHEVLPEDIDGDGDLDLWVGSIGDAGTLVSFLQR